MNHELEKTKQNQRINEITMILKEILPEVLNTTGFANEKSLHSTFGGKNALYIDIKDEVIHTPDHFINLWLQGCKEYIKNIGKHYKKSSYYKGYMLLKEHKILLEYVLLFLERTYLRQYASLSKNRPSVEESSIWIGQERAIYGILVTPIFHNGNWKNDKSEIRHFKRNYWTIGHILKTGLVIPYVDDRIQFRDVDEYLTFFKYVIVRLSGSIHEMAIADRYINFVKNSINTDQIPLLIPEIRYGGLTRKHEYRLDFCIIDPYTMEKIGFELSPWSTHGQLTGIKNLTQAKVNEKARENFEKEIVKIRSFFQKLRIFVLIYSDTDLSNHDRVFEDIEKYLIPLQTAKQLRLSIMEDFFELD